MTLPKLHFTRTLALLLATAPMQAQSTLPDWCRTLPRPEYKTLPRVPVSDSWFEVYKVAPGVFAIYEPHQFEETISYLITGDKQALLFDAGMGIGDLKKVTSELTRLPIIVLNSHTHNDHVGGNWQFPSVYAVDVDFTRANARGSRDDAQAEIAPGQICGDLPKGFNPKTYATRPWKITSYVHDGDRIDLGGRSLEVLATPGHTPDAISLLDRTTVSCSPGTRTIPRRSGFIAPRPTWTPTVPRSRGWLHSLLRSPRSSAPTTFPWRRRRP